MTYSIYKSLFELCCVSFSLSGMLCIQMASAQFPMTAFWLSHIILTEYSLWGTEPTTIDEEQPLSTRLHSYLQRLHNWPSSSILYLFWLASDALRDGTWRWRALGRDRAMPSILHPSFYLCWLFRYSRYRDCAIFNLKLSADSCQDHL